MSSSSSNTSAASWTPRPLSKRSKLQNGTFIVPSTGERARRQLSLRTSSSLDISREISPNSFQSFSDQTTWDKRIRVVTHNAKAAATSLWTFANSPDGHAVLKCSLAYLLGSLATLWSPLSNWLGHRDGKHVVATLTVYFHPARTVGSMLEAILMAIIAVCYAEIISVFAMLVPLLFRTTFGGVAIAHAVVLVVCIGGGLGFMAWVKQKLNSPLSNVASTLASVAIISVVTKEDAVHWGEFSVDKIVQVLKMLVMGISFAVLVNLLVWRQSARSNLRKATVTASISLGDMLSAITKGFLNGTEDELRSSEFGRVCDRYASAHGAMSGPLREVKFERYFVGHEDLYQFDKAIVKSMEALASAIGGLRSASNTQFVLLKELPVSESPLDESYDFLPYMASSLRISRHNKPLQIIPESQANMDSFDPATGPFRMPSDIFDVFIKLLGPSMKSLAWTLSEILRESPFGPAPDYRVTGKEQFRASLREALELYNSHRSNALQELYKTVELRKSKSERIQADIEDVAAACGHFSFSLLAVAEEMDAYLDVLDDLKDRVVAGKRSWEWLKVWKYFPYRNQEASFDDPESETLLEAPVRAIRKSALPKGIPDTMLRQRDTFNWDAAPQASRILRLISQKVLAALRAMAKDDIRFGIKVAIGAMAWGALAFHPQTRETYVHWRGEWGLLSFMIVASMTKGASNTTGIARFIGTLIGAGTAIVSWFITFGNPIALALFGWFASLFNFYLILVVKNGPLGRISLLAYNVTALYAYSLSQRVDDDDDDEGGQNPLILEICYHRVIAVTLGILWGIIVCRIIWPISGRTKFREGIAVLYLQLGLIWKRGPLAALVNDDVMQPYMRTGEQAALQRYASKLEYLRVAARSEFSLRGPFPIGPYSRIMESTNRILDSLYAMKLLTEKRHNLTDGEKALLKFTESERAQLRNRICHVFQVIASSMMLEYPLTDALPSVEGVKDRLLGKIYKFRKGHVADNEMADGVTMEESDYALLYAYTLVSVQVARELVEVQKEVEGLFGVLTVETLLLQ